jgi:hypothetical protein
MKLWEKKISYIWVWEHHPVHFISWFQLVPMYGRGNVVIVQFLSPFGPWGIFASQNRNLPIASFPKVTAQIRTRNKEVEKFGDIWYAPRTKVLQMKCHQTIWANGSWVAGLIDGFMVCKVSERLLHGHGINQMFALQGPHHTMHIRILPRVGYWSELFVKSLGYGTCFGKIFFPKSNE